MRNKTLDRIISQAVKERSEKDNVIISKIMAENVALRTRLFILQGTSRKRK